jgi:hypothetical protein
VKFENVTGSSFTLIGQSLNFRNFVNGIQIVQVPEPSSAVLAMVAGGTMCVLRRRSGHSQRPKG